MSTEDKPPPKYLNVTPHGEVEKVLDGVYIVRGSFNMMPGIRIARTMCIVQRGSSLTIFNSIRVNEKVEAQIKALGSVDKLVRLNAFHGADDQYYLDTFKCKYWSVPGVSVTDSPSDHTLSETDKPYDDCSVYLFENVKTPEAVVLIPEGGGTLITCDVLQNSTDMTYANILGKGMCQVMGFGGTCKCVPFYRNSQQEKDKPFYPDFVKILSWKWDNLITAHGPAKIGGAHEATQEEVDKIWKKEAAAAAHESSAS